MENRRKQEGKTIQKSLRFVVSPGLTRKSDRGETNDSRALLIAPVALHPLHDLAVCLAGLVGCRENCAFVILKHFQPRSDIAGMAGNRGCKAHLRVEKGTAQFGDQFLESIGLRAESIDKITRKAMLRSA